DRRNRSEKGWPKDSVSSAWIAANSNARGSWKASATSSVFRSSAWPSVRSRRSPSMSRRSHKEDKENYEHSQTTLRPYCGTKPDAKTLKEMNYAIPASRKERPDHWRPPRHRSRDRARMGATRGRRSDQLPQE